MKYRLYQINISPIRFWCDSSHRTKTREYIVTIRTGEARNSTSRYKTSRHCVAYLDFLGGTGIISYDDQNKYLNTTNMISEDAVRESKMFAKTSL